MRNHPDGINRLQDYIGCIVRVRRYVQAANGRLLSKGSIYIVRSTWRGLLTLNERTGTLGGHGPVVARGVEPHDIEVIAWRLAEVGVEMTWTEEFDEHDNSMWTAPSPYHDEGLPFRWRLGQRLRENRVQWYAAHDEELGGDCGGIFWSSLVAAKASVQNAHGNIVASLE